ncbi:hypothetical protein BGW39_000213 [Mortierella sp. 14UC]|nr:hypothetical protein BGW39_000213 [Mortierella sp. 14UC]
MNPSNTMSFTMAAMPPFNPAPPASSSSKRSKTGNIINPGLAPMQLGPANMRNPFGHHVVGYSASESDDAVSVNSGKPSRPGFKKRLSSLFKGDRKAKNAPIIAPRAQVPIHRVHSAIPEGKVHAVPLSPDAPRQPVDAATTKSSVPAIQIQDSNVTRTLISQAIFPENVTPASLTVPLFKPYTRIEKTTQLVYGCQLLSKDQAFSPDSDTDELQEVPLNETQQAWVQLIDPIEQDRLHWIVEKLVKAFVEDDLKGSAAIGEIVILGPILDREMYRTLLNCFIGQFEQDKLLDATLLQGLVQLVECASDGYLVDDDLVRIATALFKELSVTHNGTSDHVLLLTLALGRVLDVMVAGKIKDLNRGRDHQPVLQLLDGLKGSDNAYVKYQAAYGYQALQYVPDDETPLQVVWRYSKMAAAGASAVSSIFNLDPTGLLQGLESLQEIGASVIGVVKAGIDGYQPLREGTGTAVRMMEDKFAYMKKRSWYLTLQVTALFIRQGRLSDFKQVVIQAPCRHDANFQWGVCRQLGEIAVYQLWDEHVREQAIDFLGALYKNNTYWKPHEDVKRWIPTLLQQISSQLDPPTNNCALTMLNELRNFGATEFPGTFPLNACLPLPASFPLLTRVQEIPKVKYDLYKLRMQRIDEYKQAVYIAPMAKPSLQAPDDSLFPLMDKVEEFLAGDGQVMLVLGESGAGKSTFNCYLEHLLWQRYKPGHSIPLFINLPSLDHPDRDIIAEQLKAYRFTEAQIQELELYHPFTLICDGYDESQLTCNIHTSNALNQAGQRKAKILITCRTQYLGPDYRDRFVPNAAGYHRSANNLFLEAVIAPFSKPQIELYVEKYVPLESRTWVKKDYMDKLTTIPKLMGLVKNPFLLTLALETLPKVVEGKADLSKLRVTRVELYDTFAEHWLGVNKRRLRDQRLKDDRYMALEDLLNDGFEQNGIDFQKRLAAAIFREQEGKPVVEYSHMRDKRTWKKEFFSRDVYVALLREASLLGRVGNQYRFIHRSILEYFFSCAVWDATRSEHEFAPQVYLSSTGNNFSIGDHPLSQKSLVPEFSIIQFFVERVQTYPDFMKHLLALVELSKSHPQACQAAANAITILVRAGIRFNGANLRGIRISGADLTAGQFDSAQLQDSDLTGVNFSKAWIRRADFSRAQMEGARFGELPHLKEDGWVTSCAVSPDGKVLAAGLDSGNISIYDTVTWTKTTSFEGHRLTVTSLTFSPTSSHLLLSGSHDGSVRVWDRETGSAIHVLECHIQAVTAVAYSPCGKQVASASYDKTARLWDAETGAALFVLEGHEDWVNGVAYSPDGSNIVSSSKDGTVRMFDTCSGRLLLASGKSEVGYQCVAYAPDGRRIALGDVEGGLQLWNAATLESELEWEGHSWFVSSVQFSTNGRWILSSSWDKSVQLWDANTGALMSAFEGHSHQVTNAVFVPESLQVVSSSWDKTVRLWEMNLTGLGAAAGGAAAAEDNTINSRTVAVYSPDGRFIISQCHARMVQQYGADTGEPSLVLRLEESNVNCAAYSPTGLQIATGDSEGKVTLWNAQSGAIEHILCGHSASICVLAYSPCGQWVASGGDDGTARVWDASSGSLKHFLDGHYRLGSLAFSPNGLDLAVAGYYGKTNVWELSSGTYKTVMGGPGSLQTCVAYPPGSSQIACSYSFKGEGIRLFEKKDEEDMKKENEEMEGEGRTFRTIVKQEEFIIDRFAFSTCGRWIAAVDGHVIRVWSRASDEATSGWVFRTTVEGLFDKVAQISWRPRRNEFATASIDGSVRVWKVVEVEKSKSNEVSVRLVWGRGGVALAGPGAVFVGVFGISAINRKLLGQRGADF